MTERKYALTRVDAGDYLWPSNDGATLWRVTRYLEDGSLSYNDGTVVRGHFWSVHRYHVPVTATTMLPDDFLEWGEHWRTYSTLHKTRREAIDDTLDLVSYG